MFNLIIGLNHTGSQILSQGSETRNLWNYDTKRKISISFRLTYNLMQFKLVKFEKQFTASSWQLH